MSASFNRTAYSAYSSVLQAGRGDDCHGVTPKRRPADYKPARTEGYVCEPCADPSKAKVVQYCDEKSKFPKACVSSKCPCLVTDLPTYSNDHPNGCKDQLCGEVARQREGTRGGCPSSTLT